MNITLLHDDAGQRYNLYVDGQYAAYAEAWRSGRVADMSHTETFPAFRGQGLAAKVVRFALDDLAAKGVKVSPSCWFVAEFIAANPEYQPLIVTP